MTPRHPRRVRNRSLLFGRLKSKPCHDCDGRFPYYVMQFDHVRGEKIACIGSMKFLRIDRILAEVAKCDLVCANCHAIRTHRRRDTLRRRRRGRLSREAA